MVHPPMLFRQGLWIAEGHFVTALAVLVRTSISALVAFVLTVIAAYNSGPTGVAIAGPVHFAYQLLLTADALRRNRQPMVLA